MEVEILIIDGEEDVLNAIEKILKDKGYRIEKAKSWQVGLKYIKKKSYDLTIVNLEIPGISGEALIEKINKYDLDIAIVALATDPVIQSCIEMLKAGIISDYLQKPIINHQELIESVSRSLEKRKLILKKKKLIDELKLSESRLHTLLNTVPAALFESSPVSPYPRIFLTEELEKMSGFSAEEWRNNADFWLKHIHPDDKEHLLSEIGKAISERRRTGYELEYRFLASDDRVIWLKDKASFLKDEDERIISIIGISFDVTAQKEIERKLDLQNKEREKELNILYQSGKEIVSKLEFGKVLDSILKNVTQILPVGYSSFAMADEPDTYSFIAGYNIPKDLYEKRRFKIGQGLEGLVAKEKILKYSYDIQQEQLCNLIDFAKRYNIRSCIAAPIIIGKDIVCVMTAYASFNYRFNQKEMELFSNFGNLVAIALENAKLYRDAILTREASRNIVYTSPDATVLTDIDGIVVEFNKSAEDITRYSNKEMINRAFFELFSDEESELIKSIYHDIQKEKIIRSKQINILTKDGNVIPVRFSASILRDEEGEDIGIINIFHDLREERRCQEIIVQEDKFKALGKMASGVAHSINNILAAIMGYAELGLKTSQDEKLIRYLESIKKSVKRGAQVVRNLQEFTQMRKDKDFAKINLNDIIIDAIEATEPRWKDQAERENISINIDTELGEIPYIIADPMALKEAVVNIILNAIEAMPEGGNILIGTKLEEDHVTLKIKDTGIGMPEEIKNQIFEPFFTTKGPQKSGLGMSITYGVIKRHNWDIDIKSSEMEGTEVKIRIPHNHG